jgi:hypothetical protein
MSEGLIKACIKGSTSSSFRSIIGCGIVVRENRLSVGISITSRNGGLGVTVTARSVSIYRVDICSVQSSVTAFGCSEVT